MLWVKALHIIFVVAWFAGLFYLPRLFVYHAQATDAPSIERFKVMERKLFWGIMTPSGVLAVLFGMSLLQWFPVAGWLYAKVFVVFLVILYHVWCGKLLGDFARDRNRHGHVWYRWFNEAPVLALVAIVVLAVVKPF